MPDDPSRPAPRKTHTPLMDALGELCKSGADNAAYLWQVPDDMAVREQIKTILEGIRTESVKEGRREMQRIVEELETALAASPSPQQVEILQDGFDRLQRLWQAAKSGLM